jgi:hypothetical protein
MAIVTAVWTVDGSRASLHHQWLPQCPAIRDKSPAKGEARAPTKARASNAKIGSPFRSQRPPRDVLLETCIGMWTDTSAAFRLCAVCFFSRRD